MEELERNIKCPYCKKLSITPESIKELGKMDIKCSECGKVAFKKLPKWVIEGKTPKQHRIEENALQI